MPAPAQLRRDQRSSHRNRVGRSRRHALKALGLNGQRSKEPRVISTAASALPVLVVPTDEERAIAEATAAVVGASVRQ